MLDTFYLKEHPSPSLEYLNHKKETDIQYKIKEIFWSLFRFGFIKENTIKDFIHEIPKFKIDINKQNEELKTKFFFIINEAHKNKDILKIIFKILEKATTDDRYSFFFMDELKSIIANMPEQKKNAYNIKSIQDVFSQSNNEKRRKAVNLLFQNITEKDIKKIYSYLVLLINPEILLKDQEYFKKCIQKNGIPVPSKKGENIIYFLSKYPGLENIIHKIITLHENVCTLAKEIQKYREKIPF